MNVLSLFDGMSCGRIALDRAGIKVDSYYASELDKYAITVAQANWPSTVQLGDVTKWREWDIDWSSIDLLIDGSPCQGFSFAGKQLAFNDHRSKLFFVYVDILNHIKSVNSSVKFLLENVKMKKEYMDVIDYHLGVESILINSSLVSAQNRKRNYWANIPIDEPIDKEVILSDIIDGDCSDINSDGWHSWWEEKKDFQIKKKYSALVNDGSTDKAICMTARQYASWNGNFAIMQKGRGNNPGGYRVIDGKTPSLTDCSWQDNNHLVDGVKYRKLTPVECERLQTVPDNYTKHVSNTQRYKMLGNGWTVDVIAHIFKGLLC